MEFKDDFLVLDLSTWCNHGDLEKALKEVDVAIWRGVRGQSTLNFGCVKVQIPDGNPRRDLEKADEYPRIRLKNKGGRGGTSGWSVDKKRRGKARAPGTSNVEK